jgi:gamma-glutamyltranspeptidase/glutathione hydrolase/leukotriene-C4 hydrolase
LTDSPLSYHRIVEAFKFGHARKKILGDDDSDEILKLVQRLIDPKYADEIRLKINDSTTFDDFEYYGGKVSSPDDHGTAHISILAPNGDAVAVTSTINFM